jgi:hypothetical protein
MISEVWFRLGFLERKFLTENVSALHNSLKLKRFRRWSKSVCRALKNYYQRDVELTNSIVLEHSEAMAFILLVIRDGFIRHLYD